MDDQPIPAVVQPPAPTPVYYRIRDWEALYENNRTRLVKVMQWVPCPVKLDGEGWSYLATCLEDGPAIFTGFWAVIQVAARCTPRGALLRSNGYPHTPITLSLKSRLSHELIQRTLLVCSTDPLDWLECVPWSPAYARNPATVPSYDGDGPANLTRSHLPPPNVELQDPIEWQRQARATRDALKNRTIKRETANVQT